MYQDPFKEYMKKRNELLDGVAPLSKVIFRHFPKKH